MPKTFAEDLFEPTLNSTNPVKNYPELYKCLQESNGIKWRSQINWGAELVAQMFSFLVSMRLQGYKAIASLCELLSIDCRCPPGLYST
ncbi:MAG: hypothetical protein F6K10_26040 [Moorea sp. SIO2B7]|nr:hypothetical protein [Moorena sp. SIO2B7]